jgi:hypothetical protein
VRQAHFYGRDFADDLPFHLMQSNEMANHQQNLFHKSELASPLLMAREEMERAGCYDQCG